MGTTNTPFEEGLDNILQELSYKSCAEGFTTSDYNDVGYCSDEVEKAKSALTQLHEAAVRKARLEEQNFHLDKLKSGKWKSYATEVNDRIAALQNKTNKKEKN